MEDNEHATQTQQASVDAALANRVRYQGTSATHCRDCEEPIPERRRAAIAGCTRCAPCQQDRDIRA